MTNRFMVSVAALALIAGTGFANAQGMSKEPGGGGAAMQHSAPSDTSAAPSQSPSSTGTSKSEANEPKANEPSKGGMKSTQTDQKPGAMKHERAEDNNVKGGSTKERAEDRGKGTNENQRAEDKSGNMKEGRDNNMKAEGREGTRNNMNAEGKSTTERTQTTGQAGANAKLSTEQRTKITTVIRNEHVASVNNVNFSLSVGTRVPREGVSFHRLPTEVVSIYPEWRGYEYILVHEQIVVIDPATYEIVAVLDV